MQKQRHKQKKPPNEQQGKRGDEEVE